MDLAVVGAGITGLGAAAFASRGHAVTVFEAAPRVGGAAAVEHISGLPFCPGPQFIWGFGPDGEGTRIFRRMGVHVPMRRMPANFDALSLGDGVYHDGVGGSSEAALERVVRRDPAQAGPIARFTRALDLVGEACVAISAGARFMDTGVSMLHHILTRRHLPLQARSLVLRNHRETVAGFAGRLGLCAEAVRIVVYHQGIFAERLDELSLVLFAAARHHLKQAHYVPEGGTRRVATALADHITANGGTIRLGQEVTSVARSGTGWEIRSRGTHDGEESVATANRVVFACAPPIAARLLPSMELRHEPGFVVSALCLAAEVDEGVRQGLADRNFTWYRTPAEDVDFHAAPERLEYLNFTSPTLNGGEPAPDGRCVIVAFYPGGAEAASLAAQAEAVVQAHLARFGDARVGDRRIIGRRQWEQDFGSYAGAAYGRRLTSMSLRQRAAVRTPPGIRIAHSSVGIPGIIGCLEMAERVTDELGVNEGAGR